ncbi:tRNA epoxyqueuosine(34) reductase QueG [Calderihabitans maritimus]|uniref:4Fe-4S ferredoxin-type domain-containing protein n=1 Tax=Calderihabitans maritimus TaxID=1246530 RepID=A0A1Z5HNX9_9FIRM|nr:tRNA epoxyqueuosine(34) reductase QueG [Calderihabitans maritimus]GAW91224.1 hypothetical protein KKC1_03860 [Calderihabitans maritimus]
MSLSQEIKNYAEGLGINRVRICGPEPFEELLPLLQKRKEAGYGTPFEERDLQLRIEPRRLLPEVRSIIAVSVSYGGKAVGSRVPQELKPGISYHAWGEDYHRALRRQLEQLVDFLEIRVGRKVQSLICVDATPLVERAVARRSGLGWYGKNCSLITPDEGSWVFLGEILVDVELDRDYPLDHRGCGNCSRCLEACPAGALRAPYTLDSSRCLSYISQKSGFIPEEFRSLLGTRLYGCDTCQLVCPYNHSPEPVSQASIARPERFTAELVKVLSLNRQEFYQMFGFSVLAWRGKNVLARNAAVALGNLGDEDAVPGLKKALLEHPSPTVRGHAAWALGRIGGSSAGEALVRAKKMETDSRVLKEIERALV